MRYWQRFRVDPSRGEGQRPTARLRGARRGSAWGVAAWPPGKMTIRRVQSARIRTMLPKCDQTLTRIRAKFGQPRPKHRTNVDELDHRVKGKETTTLFQNWPNAGRLGPMLGIVFDRFAGKVSGHNLLLISLPAHTPKFRALFVLSKSLYFFSGECTLAALFVRRVHVSSVSPWSLLVPLDAGAQRRCLVLVCSRLLPGRGRLRGLAVRRAPRSNACCSVRCAMAP